MPSWMDSIEKAAAAWAAAGGHRVPRALAGVVKAVEDAWREGAPTEEAIKYARRRVAHYGGGKRS